MEKPRALGSVRKHQREMSDLADRIASGLHKKKLITLDCTPGGGKTGAATLLANRLLDAGMIDSVLWIVPRLSLGQQVADAFAGGFASCRDRRLEVARDSLFAESFQFSPIVGCVTTYQAVASRDNWRSFLAAMAGRRVLVVFDEVQFLNDEGDAGWTKKVRRIKDAAAFTLLMSGTLWRTDNKRIPFVEYERRGDGKWYPLWDIRYTLRDATAEKAVLNMEWRNRSAVVGYVHNGKMRLEDLANEATEEESRKIRAFLAGDKAVGQLLDDMVCEWREYCRQVYHSRMIVMAEDVFAANRWAKYLKERHGLTPVVAHSKKDTGGRDLKHFREKRIGDCLVTVAMAYVGFDCPDLTHLAYLSAIRAPSWMLQSAARVSRFDASCGVAYERQIAHVYAPDDAPLRNFFQCIRSQQDLTGISEQEKRGGGRGKGNGEGEGDAIDPVAGDFEPVSAEPGDRAVESLSGRLQPHIVKQLDALAARCPAAAKMTRTDLFDVLTVTGHQFASEAKS